MDRNVLRTGEELENGIQSTSEQSAHEIFHHGDDNCELSLSKKLCSHHVQ